MNLADELKARGLIEHSSAAPERILAVPRTVYVGVDPTADSLHVGHLTWVLLMKRLGDAGNKLIFLVATFPLALAYHIFPVASVYNFTPAVDALFAPKAYFWWWFVGPSIGLFFLAR